MITSKYFSKKELDCECCGEVGMDQGTVNLLDALRQEFGGPLSLTSAYRCAKHNAAEGGAPASQHITGRAADIAWGNMSGEDKQKLLEIAVRKFRGIGLHPMFLHVDSRLGPEVVFFYPR